MISKYDGPKNAMPQLSLFGARTRAAYEKNYFFALSPSPEVRQQLANVADQLNSSRKFNGSFVPSERYYLKLLKLDQAQKVRPGLVEKAIVAANKIRAKPFDVLLDRFTCADGRNGRFPGVLTSENELLELQIFWKLLRNNLIAVKLGVELSDSFSPHITLLYNRQRLAEIFSITPVSWRISDFVLIENSAGKSEHIEIGRWVLSENNPVKEFT